MGGGLNISHKGNGNGHRGRPFPYGLMLVLAFGAALIGVMALHKLRERRIFNLLVDEKNSQLISFQLLLQKERETTKEMKRKAEETKAKIYYLRNQKLELDRRILEMQSTIDSLRDEQMTMESKLEEKQNVIKLLQDKDMDSGNENRRVIALTATLKQKEAEMEDLKHRLKSSVRVWSVSTDNPSNPPVNITVMGSMKQKEETEFSHKEGEGGRVHESSYNYGGEKATNGQDGNETKSNFSQKEDVSDGLEDGSEQTGESTRLEDGSEQTGESILEMDVTGGGQLQKQESLGGNERNEGDTREMKHEYSKHTGSISKTDVENNHATASDTIDDMDEKEKKSSSTAGQLEKLKNAHQDGENSRISRLPGRLGHSSRTKGKRWRIIAKNRFLKKNVNAEVESIRSRRFSNEYKEVVRSREAAAVSGEGEAERGKGKTGLRKEIDHTKANLFKHQNSEDTEDVKHRKIIVETTDQVERDNAMSRNHDNSIARVLPENTGANGEASGYTHDAKQLKVEEAPKIKQNINSGDRERGKKAELSSARRDETEEDMEVADKQEPETDGTNDRDLFSDFMSDLENKEGYKEEAEESEF